MYEMTYIMISHKSLSFSHLSGSEMTYAHIWNDRFLHLTSPIVESSTGLLAALSVEPAYASLAEVRIHYSFCHYLPTHPNPRRRFEQISMAALTVEHAYASY